MGYPLFEIVLALKSGSNGVRAVDLERNSKKELSMNIYVGNLAYSFTEDDLRELFIECGELEVVKIIKEKFTGQSKGFGFVEMPSNSEADQAIKALNGKLVDGRNIKVNPADPGGKRSKRSSATKHRPPALILSLNCIPLISTA